MDDVFRKRRSYDLRYASKRTIGGANAFATAIVLDRSMIPKALLHESRPGERHSQSLARDGEKGPGRGKWKMTNIDNCNA